MDFKKVIEGALYGAGNCPFKGTVEKANRLQTTVERIWDTTKEAMKENKL